MSLKDLKVTDEEFSSYGVISQPDTLTGTPEENKAVFDALIRRVSIEHINKLIDELSTSGAADMGTEPFGAVTATTVQAALEQIYALIGSTYSGTDGAGKVGFSGTSSIQASNVQAAIEAVQANLAALIALLKSQQGAAQVGNAPIAGLTATTVQAALAELRDQIQDIVAGSIPSQSVTTEQIQDGAVTAEKIGFTGEDIPTSDTDSTSISSQLSNAALSSLGRVPDADLLAWANAQPRSGSFSVSPSITTEGVPAVAWYMGYLEVSDSGRRMTITDSSNQFLTWTNITASSQWTGWKPLATATPPQEFDLPLADGYTPQYTHSCIYYKTQETIVGVNVALIGEIPANSDVIIGTLPVGFRPKATCRGVAGSHFSPYGVGSVSIDENGNINVRFTAAQVRCNFTICFLAAG